MIFRWVHSAEPSKIRDGDGVGGEAASEKTGGRILLRSAVIGDVAAHPSPCLLVCDRSSQNVTATRTSMQMPIGIEMASISVCL